MCHHAWLGFSFILHDFSFCFGIVGGVYVCGAGHQIERLLLAGLVLTTMLYTLPVFLLDSIQWLIKEC